MNDQPDLDHAQPVRRVAHWGAIDHNLLFDPIRFHPYAAAHHAAAHHWCLNSAGHPLRSAGLSLANQTSTIPIGGPEPEAYVEATAVLVEAMAVEAVVHSLYDREFGIDARVEWPAVCEHLGDCRLNARRRGCVGTLGVDSLLRNPDWVCMMGRRVLRGWGGIVALAEALGHGHVLEADQVAQELQR